MVIARQYSLVDTPGQYIERADVGDVVRVKLTLVAPTDLYYVVVEDPLPPDSRRSMSVSRRRVS
jgi:uncharacterized protein YfaS (alpha-2-macroglobulin family)